MIERCFDAGKVNELLNDPLVRPTVGGEGELDATALIDDRRNVFLMADGGGACFAWRGPGVFEGHSFFRVRGAQALALGRALLACMALNYDAALIWGLTPVENKAARWFNRKLGFKSLGPMQSPEGWGELFEMRF